MVSVIINQWQGDGPRYPHCLCWACNKPATVAEITAQSGAILVRLCGTCLHDALVSIHESILEDCRIQARAKNRTDGDDDGYPD